MSRISQRAQAALTTVSTFFQRMRRGRCVVVVFKAPHFPRNWSLIQDAPPGETGGRMTTTRRCGRPRARMLEPARSST